MVEEQADNSTHRTVTVMLLLSRLYSSQNAHGGRASRQLDHRPMTVMLLFSRLYSSHSVHGGRASRQLDS